MKFEDIKLEYNNEIHVVPANKVMKLYRGVAGQIKWAHIAESATLIGDEPWLFSDAYVKALSFADCDADSGDAMAWMINNNYTTVLDALVKIKTLFNPPAEIEKKTGTAKKKKVAKKAVK